MVRRKSPQEKKALSYAKDRRNDYGENDKSSRRNIRRNKRFPHRADRHREHQTMGGALGPVDLERAEGAEIAFRAEKSRWIAGRWRKWRDAPLGEVVARKLRRRADERLRHEAGAPTGARRRFGAAGAGHSGRSDVSSRIDEILEREWGS
ncbi:hypothetical protein [Nocardia yamanashiensis]|uniref:hypothetical protein n=1 Tax=Nocardia yamanashiensis TaxID=209247 RepID=UPI00083218CC|nr:hypothetical protein [Nocardia yamanashiensis]